MKRGHATVIAVTVAALVIVTVLTAISGSASRRVSSQTQLGVAGELLAAGRYADALTALDNLSRPVGSTAVTELRQRIINDWIGATRARTSDLIGQYDYRAAAAEIAPLLDYPQGEASLRKLYDTCIAFSTTKPYDEPVEHIFFHPLMVYTDLVYDGDYQQQGFDNFMVTVDEFRRTIKQFHKAGYILVDIEQMYETQPDGTIKPKQLTLPEGKKPLIISLDDYNFLRYMRENGCVTGLALDEQGNVVTYAAQADGSRTYSRDNEAVPILDQYVADNPDFSWGGTKGIIALNGYEGALGFPTDDLTAADYPQVLAEARAVANRLKATGWRFACHSYSHYRPSKRSESQMRWDIDTWLKEVGAVVGETDIYIYPFGERIASGDPKFTYLLSKGFHVFCDVWSKHPSTRFHGQYLDQSRRNVDGITLQNHALANIIDDSHIPSPVRPWYKSATR